MAQRKSRKSRKRRGGRRRPGFLYQFLSVLFICVAMVAGCIVFFKVDTIQVEGAQKYTGDQIMAASGISKGDNLFLVNKFNAISRMFKQLPYLDQIMIRRRLPDMLVITVTEAQPVAVIESNQAYWLMDQKGKLLEKKKEDPGTCANIVGIEPLSPVQGSYLTLKQDSQRTYLLTLIELLSDKKLISHIKEINLSDAGATWLRYENRFTIKLDPNSDLNYKTEFMARVLEQIQSNEKGSIYFTRDGAAFKQY